MVEATINLVIVGFVCTNNILTPLTLRLGQQNSLEVVFAFFESLLYTREHALSVLSHVFNSLNPVRCFITTSFYR